MTKQPNSDGKTEVSRAATLFGKRVRDRRTQLRLSQEKLADECELHWSYVGQVERGQRNLTLHNIIILAAALKIEPGELVNGLPLPSPAERRQRQP